jgi:hypothetical protein
MRCIRFDAILRHCSSSSVYQIQNISLLNYPKFYNYKNTKIYLNPRSYPLRYTLPLLSLWMPILRTTRSCNFILSFLHEWFKRRERSDYWGAEQWWCGRSNAAVKLRDESLSVRDVILTSCRGNSSTFVSKHTFFSFLCSRVNVFG